MENCNNEPLKMYVKKKARKQGGEYGKEVARMYNIGCAK